MSQIRLNHINAAKSGPRSSFFLSGAQLYACGSNYYSDGEMNITVSANARLEFPYVLSDIRGQLRDVGVFRTGVSQALFVIAENGSVLVRGEVDLGALGGCGETVLKFEGWKVLEVETSYNEIQIGSDSVTFALNPLHEGLYDGQTEKDFEKAVNILWVMFWLFAATIVVCLVIFLTIFLCRINKRCGCTCACCLRSSCSEQEPLVRGSSETDKQE